MDIINNLNVEVLMCYKDVFNFQYFKKNINGFIIIILFVLHTICIIYYYIKIKGKIIRYIFSLTENYISYLSKRKNMINNKTNKNKIIKKHLKNCPIKKNNNINIEYNSNKNRKKGKIISYLKRELLDSMIKVKL